LTKLLKATSKAEMESPSSSTNQKDTSSSRLLKAISWSYLVWPRTPSILNRWLTTIFKNPNFRRRRAQILKVTILEGEKALHLFAMMSLQSSSRTLTTTMKKKCSNFKKQGRRK